MSQVKALLSEGINRPRKGADAGDHPPITPMRAASESELGTAVRRPHFIFTHLLLKGQEILRSTSRSI